MQQEKQQSKLRHILDLSLTKKQIKAFFNDYDPQATEYWQSLSFPVQFRITRLADILDGEFEHTDFDGGDDGGNSRTFSYVPNPSFNIVIRYVKDFKIFTVTVKEGLRSLSFIETAESSWLSHRLDVIVNLIGNIKLNNGEYWDCE